MVDGASSAGPSGMSRNEPGACPSPEKISPSSAGAWGRSNVGRVAFPPVSAGAFGIMPGLVLSPGMPGSCPDTPSAASPCARRAAGSTTCEPVYLTALVFAASADTGLLHELRDEPAQVPAREISLAASRRERCDLRGRIDILAGTQAGFAEPGDASGSRRRPHDRGSDCRTGYSPGSGPARSGIPG